MSADWGWDDPPVARIKRAGRWIYHITVEKGPTTTTPPWYAWGRRHAQRKAARKLRWYLKRESYKADVTEGDE